MKNEKPPREARQSDRNEAEFNLLEILSNQEYLKHENISEGNQIKKSVLCYFVL